MAIQRLDTLPANGAGRTRRRGERAFETSGEREREREAFGGTKDTSLGFPRRSMGTKAHKSGIRVKNRVDSSPRDVPTLIAPDDRRRVINVTFSSTARDREPIISPMEI